MRRWLLVPLGILAAYATVALFARVWFELQGTFYSDVSLFLTVARGWLNGFTPYVDLYENKPPGMFALLAISLSVFSDVTLVSWLQALVLLALPLTIAVPVWIYCHGERSEPFFQSFAPLRTTLVAFLLGCILALYTGMKAGQLLPESFGAFFGCAFMGLVFLRPPPWRWWFSVILGVLLFCAVMLKEPFVLPILGGALLLLPSWRQSPHLLLPSVIAGVMGVVILMLMGLLIPYVTMELTHLIGHQVGHPWGTVSDSFWLRFINVYRIGENLTTVSVALAFLIASIWIGTLVVLGRKGILRWVTASLFTTVTVGLTGDFYFHHFIFAVPFYAACTLVVLRGLHQRSERVQQSVIGAGCVLAFFILFAMPLDHRGMIDDFRAWESERKAFATVLDTTMDRCGLERYFNFIDRPEGFYGFTRHSPYGPVFTQYGRLMGGVPNAPEGFLIALSESPLLIVKGGEGQVKVDPDTQASLRNIFTEEPWACAGSDFKQADPYRILFRKSSP